VKYVIDNTQADMAIEGLELQRSDWLAKHNMNEMNRLVQSAEDNKNI
jgi:hypothetical protein